MTAVTAVTTFSPGPPMRPFFPLVALASFTAAPAFAQQPARPDTTRPQQRTGQAEGPKPYAEVITRAATTDSGVFILHQIGEKLFYEIPRAQLNKEFLLVVDYAATPEGTRYGGENLDSRVVRWQRMGNRVLLRSVSYDLVADSSTPVSRAVRLSNLEPVLISFDVAAFSPNADSNLVIEVTRLFTTDVPELTARRAFRLRRLDPARSLVESARSFPTNIDVKALHTFENDSVPGDRGLGTMSFEMHYSMVSLPERPMARRLCDHRVGFFSVRQIDYGREAHRVQERCYITRWRLDPKDPNAAVSDPIKPIVFYLDPATPEKWAPWIIKGVEAWEPVFRAAGFSNAITARRAPTPQEDPAFDLDDARYSTIRWLPSQIENAYGPHTSDPRTGEILQSNIGWYQNITSLLEAWWWVQVGAVDPRARRLPLPDSLVGQMVAYVATHEVGHTLGLPHNQLSSGYYPVDSLRSPTYTRKNGTSYSIMDYARNNYVAQPGDNAELLPKLGPWDYYVIDWGYRRIPGATTPDAERPLLDSLARLQDAMPWLRFGNPDGIDPRTQTEALGDDPVQATRYGLANIKRLVPMLIPATTTEKLDDYSLLDDFYDRLVGQWAFEMGHVAVAHRRAARSAGGGGALPQRQRLRDAELLPRHRGPAAHRAHRLRGADPHAADGAPQHAAPGRAAVAPRRAGGDVARRPGVHARGSVRRPAPRHLRGAHDGAARGGPLSSQPAAGVPGPDGPADQHAAGHAAAARLHPIPGLRPAAAAARRRAGAGTARARGPAGSAAYRAGAPDRSRHPRALPGHAGAD
ncbi:MAG: hypothetical protein AUG10_02425 [Gemmatimonadetes bacterium 13_1_20CM_2_70_10]|nr:MAG: hypothetical protein AUG10_02425 [Gemmatimonadetes bacterium 13_1_20CM_2_70_10]